MEKQIKELEESLHNTIKRAKKNFNNNEDYVAYLLFCMLGIEILERQGQDKFNQHVEEIKSNV